jgi:hypothetical protein
MDASPGFHDCELTRFTSTIERRTDPSKNEPTPGEKGKARPSRPQSTTPNPLNAGATEFKPSDTAE